MLWYFFRIVYLISFSQRSICRFKLWICFCLHSHSNGLHPVEIADEPKQELDPQNAITDSSKESEVCLSFPGK